MRVALVDVFRKQRRNLNTEKKLPLREGVLMEARHPQYLSQYINDYFLFKCVTDFKEVTLLPCTKGNKR